ncbi:MAG TPA: PA2169 family four-helix-bundle protein [Phycisphaerae bacterium]|nr:PA2169 family four-helix-bundle protein [Phycisphaerae bacterium]
MNQEAAPVRDALAALREACISCQSLIGAAGGVVEDSQFRRRLDERRAAWTQISQTCASLLQEFGESPEEEPTIAPTLHRAWVKIKAAIDDEKGIVKECLRREDMVREKLETALRYDLSPSTRSKLRAVLDRVVSLDVPP